MEHIVSVANSGDPDRLVELAVEVEQAGFDGFFFMDHMNTAFLGQDETLDPWVLLTAIACATERLRLGTAVTPVSRRRPWKLAKEVIALDHVSHGRVTLGVGLGDADDHEFAPFGEITDQRVRATQTDEALHILDQLFRAEKVEHSGQHYQLHAHLKPAAVQSPRPPIWIAATPPFRKGLQRAARWDGLVCNLRVRHDYSLLRPSELRDWAGELLDRPDFDVTTFPHPDHDAEEYEEVGVTSLGHTWWPPQPGWIDDFRKHLLG